MDWQAEANALIDDIKSYVRKIEVSTRHKSSDLRIFFDIVTLEGTMLTVSMDTNGFAICDKECEQKVENSMNNSEQRDETISENQSHLSQDLDVKIYETINSLLDDNSPKYREAFAHDLYNKMNSLGDMSR
jgi:hypothetical protein